MNGRYFYHLTSKENVTKILKEGLKPMCGDNSSMVDEERPAIFLCRRRDLPYWKILLEKAVVLQIRDIDIPEENHFCYDGYEEYLYYDIIPAANIKQVHITMDCDKAMRDLCFGYMNKISYCTEIAARHYSYPDKEYGPELESLLNCCLAGLKKLDYSSLTKKEIKDELKEQGENGLFTFVDTYLDTEERLYEQLIKYPDDELSDKRNDLFKLIKNAFKGCLNVYTGGWTG